MWLVVLLKELIAGKADWMYVGDVKEKLAVRLAGHELWCLGERHQVRMCDKAWDCSGRMSIGGQLRTGAHGMHLRKF